MPLDVKPLPHPHVEDDTLIGTEDRLASFIRNEEARAVSDVERRKRLAVAELEHDLKRASQRIVRRGHRLERSLRHQSDPLPSIAIGLSIIAAALLISRQKKEHGYG